MHRHAILRHDVTKISRSVLHPPLASSKHLQVCIINEHFKPAYGQCCHRSIRFCASVDNACPALRCFERTFVKRQPLVFHYLRLTCEKDYPMAYRFAIALGVIFSRNLDSLLFSSIRLQSARLVFQSKHGNFRTLACTQGDPPIWKRSLVNIRFFLLLVMLLPCFSF